jgi:hypothetical protein
MDSSSFKLKLPQLYSYHNAIKSPDELGASDAGNNATLKRDADAIFGYVGGIFSGNRNNVFKLDTPMIGDKQFFNTGIQCTKKTLQEINNNSSVNAVNVSSSQENEDKLTDRYSYIDNITKTPNNQPVGLLYQVLDDVMNLNPTDIFSSITEPPYPQCIPVTLKTIKQNVHYDIETGFETQYVIVSEIEKIDPCNFEDGVNPVVKEKTNAICDLKNSNQTAIFDAYERNRNNTTESFSNINYPKNHLIQLYIFFVLILFFYLFYRLNYK